MIPPGAWVEPLLVLVDLSWWCAAAWHGALTGIVRGREDEPTDRDHRAAALAMRATIAGWLRQLLSAPLPACVAACLDSVGPTLRHAMTADLPMERRYKATRKPKPAAFRRARNEAMELVSLHGIPLLSAEGYEADDVMATAARRGMALGLRPVLVTMDKDLATLTARGAVLWGFHGERTAGDVRDAEAVGMLERGWGVPAALVPDYLALVGDSSDNIAGVDGIGATWARRLIGLATWPTDLGDLGALTEDDAPPASPVRGIDRLLAMVPSIPSEEAIKDKRKALRKLAKAKPNALLADATESHERAVAAASAEVEALVEWTALMRKLKAVHDAREQVLLARDLVTLREDAPILGWDVDRLPVGGWDVETLRELYEEFGFYGMRAEIRPMEKATGWLQEKR